MERTLAQMITVTFAVGAILALTGVVSYIASDAASLSAFIPTGVGALMIICALIARRENLRRHAIHAALAVALLGALGSLMNVVRIGELLSGDAERPLAIVSSLIMFVVLVFYIALGVRSFIAARRQRAVSQS